MIDLIALLMLAVSERRLNYYLCGVNKKSAIFVSLHMLPINCATPIMAAEGNNIRRYIYRGEEGEVIPDDGKSIGIVHEDITVILANTFDGYRNIIEVICHEDVEKIEEYAFNCCISLKS